MSVFLRRRLLALALLAAAVTACDDSTPGPVPPPAPPSPPQSADSVVLRLADAWKARDIATYQTLLGADFTFTFAPHDTLLPGMPARWDRAMELSAGALLFSGGPGPRAQAVQRIEVALTPTSSQWVADPAGGTFARSYSVNMFVYHPSGDITLVKGGQEFHAGPVQDGQIQRWVLQSWTDQGLFSTAAPEIAEGTGVLDWGELKANFQFAGNTAR